ncbi:MAG: DUF3320 domain-containing protein [Chloroflexota bacterium]
MSYVIAKFRGQLPDDLLRDDAWRLRLGTVVAEVVKQETPVHPDVVFERVKDACGNPRATQNVKTNFDAGVAQALREQGIALGADGFLRSGDTALTTFRIGDGETLRAIEHIPEEEIAMAAIYAAQQQFGMPKEALITETAKALGYSKKPNAEGAVRISMVIDNALDRGKLRQSGNQITAL